MVEPQYQEEPRDWQYVFYNEVSLRQGSFPYILILLERRISVLLYRGLCHVMGLLYRGSTVLS